MKKPTGVPKAISFPSNCDICNGTLKARFDCVRDPVTNEIFSIFRCSNCGTGHTVPHPKELNKYYRSEYYGNRHGFTSKIFLKRSLSFLNHAGTVPTKKRLLDVGCGDGSFLLAAKNSGWKVMGTEINPFPAQALGLDVRSSLQHLPHDDRFDCITFWHSLEHMENLQKVFSKLEKFLNSEGRLIIAFPDNSSFQAKFFGPDWFHLDVPRHLYHFNTLSLNFILKKAGFRILSIKRNELEYSLFGWSQSLLNRLFPRTNFFFSILTGKKPNHFNWAELLHLILGSFLTLLFVTVLPFETLLKKSGTAVIVASRIENDK
jgi:SAM-dependent methyltransferase